MTDRDERVAAWLDGTMSESEAIAFEAELESDPALAEQVSAWQANDALLRAAFDAPMAEGVDAALLARMGLAEPNATPAPANDNPPWRRWFVPAGGAVAAGLALVLWVGSSQRPVESGAESQIAIAMEQLPSRAARDLGDGGKVSPVLSFAAADGRFCREFTVSGGVRPGGGIMCKGASGWTTEARSSTGAALPESGRVATAGGLDDQVLAGAYARLDASDPLPVDAEAQLIATGWKKRR